MVTLDDANVVSFASELQGSSETAKTSSNDEYVNAGLGIRADRCKLHGFVLGDSINIARACCFIGPMRIDPD